MKKLVLTILLVFSTVFGSEGWASGSNTVFLQVKIRQYYLKDAIREFVTNPKLIEYLEMAYGRVYVTQISPEFYNLTMEYMKSGYNVQVDFEGYEPIVFNYYPIINAVIGFTAGGSAVLLCPTLED